MVKCLEPQLDRLFGALGEPVRRAVVRDLALGEKSLSELAEPFDITLPGMMKHVAILEEAGLVMTEKRGRTRFCRLEPEALSHAQRWIEETTSFWTKRLEALATYLEEEN
ncbi:MAG: helix-turn-helix transcriptional regulator [Armatimonadetes bacterium]|nr:helix-turn-helix transcriptional regulator [Armatimonadota bacterium]